LVLGHEQAHGRCNLEAMEKTGFKICSIPGNNRRTDPIRDKGGISPALRPNCCARRRPLFA